MVRSFLQTLKSVLTPSSNQPRLRPKKTTTMNWNVKPKTNHHWQRGVPFSQPWSEYSDIDKEWVESKFDSVSTEHNFIRFSLLSWNIDFMRPLDDARMTAALKHLEKLVSGAETPCIILLQEMVLSDLKLIQAQPWIRESYKVTDLDDTYWESRLYGTCTLIPKGLPVTTVFRVHYKQTVMERDGLFVDIALTKNRCLRICNTHLESLALSPPRRPDQLKTASEVMHADGVHASVIGGDFNAIQDFDRTLHTENELQDAYLVSGGKEDVEDGYTWGQMANISERERFGLSRMDKILFCGAITLDKFATFGKGVEVEGEAERERLKEGDLDGGWVTDHLGVRADFTIGNAHESARI